MEQRKKDELRSFYEKNKREKQDAYQAKVAIKAKQTLVAKEQARRNEETEREMRVLQKAVTQKVADIQRAQMMLKAEHADTQRTLERALTSPVKK